MENKTCLKPQYHVSTINLHFSWLRPHLSAEILGKSARSPRNDATLGSESKRVGRATCKSSGSIFCDSPREHEDIEDIMLNGVLTYGFIWFNMDNLGMSKG